MVTRERVQTVIDRIRPLLQSDGGDIELVDVLDNRANVRLTGNCVGCPSAQMTLVLRRRNRAQGRDPRTRGTAGRLTSRQPATARCRLTRALVPVTVMLVVDASRRRAASMAPPAATSRTR